MANTSFEKRADRRNRLIGLLRSEGYWKTSQLREHLGISQRTLMRELAELRDAGFPVESDRGRGGGVRMSGRWGIERLNLSHHEIIELILSLAIVESLQSPLLTSNITGIKQKLFQAFPETQRAAVSNIRQRIMIGDNANANVMSKYRPPEQLVSEGVAEAFLTQRCLSMEYRSEAGDISTRKIEVQFILLNWPVWYIIAWDHLRDASRVFRIDRIIQVSSTQERFQLRPKPVFSSEYAPYYKTL